MVLPIVLLKIRRTEITFAQNALKISILTKKFNKGQKGEMK
jgi:hypothetical protein